MSTTKSTPTTVADELLSEFDRIAGDGNSMPIETIKDRYASSNHFQYRDYEIYDTVLELPVTAHMLLAGATDPVKQIVAALKEIHGDVLLIDLEAEHGSAKLRVRMWKPEDTLRRLWKGFAEAEYKTQLAVAS